MATRKIAGPGRLGSAKAVKKSLKGGGQAGIKTISAEDSLTVRFLDEPEDFHGYYEHWGSDGPYPCASDECKGCESDDPDEKKRSFKYLANAYVVDDQKVWALKMPKSLVEILMNFYTKYKGTLLDRDYELSRTGSGQFDTKYMAAPEDRQKMNLARFDKKKFDLGELLQELLDGADDSDDDDDDDDDEPVRRKKSSASKPKRSKDDKPWDDDDDEDDEDDEPVRRVKKKTTVAKKRPPVKKTTVAKKKTGVKRPVKRR